ncbi:MAG TPA: U32 family peptidase [Gemmataceae bacterium]|nr:U32 family peptidase [Gemmataceae bacterium]
MPSSTVPLTLVAEQTPAAQQWSGFRPLSPLGNASEAPEPDAPQGEYGDTVGHVSKVPESRHVEIAPHERAVELLAPAGGIDAAFAAFHYGADAIYLGLKKFSARAEAENFTLDELSEVVAYAHSLSPRRRVFVTVNTLIRNDELPELVDTIAALADMGVDALILQDLGVYHLCRRYFPQLEMHASTQLAVHNRAGAEALRQMGFRRVVLARELTFEEVHDITSESGIETEVFIHGALCYSYSGLCLFSSQTLGRSGNRGKCAYSCRDDYHVHGAPDTLRDGRQTLRNPATGFPFSMKDLALPDHIPALRSAGVSCFKIEGRKKSPLYVATTTGYYRKLIDGKLAESERTEHEADLQTVFSRPWTHLFVDSHRDKEVADRDTVGHRGTPIGRIESIHGERRATRLRFHTQRPLERHDGLQVDLPSLGKPFGFPVDHLWLIRGKRREEVIQTPAGALVEVELPADHPELPLGAAVYCSSSQAVKREYRHERPKPGQHRVRTPIDIEIVLTEADLSVLASVSRELKASATVTACGPFPAAKEPAAMATAVRSAFEKLGDTNFSLANFNFRNDGNRFVPISKLNQVRRELCAQLEKAWKNAQWDRVQRIQAECCATNTPGLAAGVRQEFRWSIKVDRISFLEAFENEDWAHVDEAVIDITRDHPSILEERLDQLAAAVGRDHIRLALPAITRKWEEAGLLHKIEKLRATGWRKWEAANLSAWSYLGLEPAGLAALAPRLVDVSTDWSVYALNRLAARQLLELGDTRFALSPEDGLDNMRPMLVEFGPQAVVIVYQDTPLFIAESCAYANLIGGCPGKANCRFESMEMESSHGEKVTAIDYHCRTIVLNQGPFCLSRRLRELAAAGAISLRADFVYRKYTPEEVRERWRQVRAGKAVVGGHAANFDRGVL